MQIFRVGGCVRDWLLGLEPKDIDYVVVGATVQDMLDQGFKQVGADFPVFLTSDGTEYALARTERKSGHGYAGFEVNADPSVTLEDDLARRDLTINAMAISKADFDKTDLPNVVATVTLVDPYNGQRDLENKVLRHTSVAFREDPVRVLRLARFMARFGPEWTVADDTFDLCDEMVASGELKHLTKERVFKELEKALGEPHPALFFRTLEQCGALTVVFRVFKDTVLWQNTIDMMEASAPSNNLYLNYAYLTYFMDPSARTLFEQRLLVPRELSVAAELFKQAFEYSRFSDCVDHIYAMDLLRLRNPWALILKGANEAGITLLQEIEDRFQIINKVGYAQLTEEQRTTLKGKDITEAIRALRKTAYFSSPLHDRYEKLSEE